MFLTALIIFQYEEKKLRKHAIFFISLRDPRNPLKVLNFQEILHDS